MESKFKLPARFAMQVYVTDGDEITGKVDIELPIGEYPTKEKILHWIKEAENQAKRQNDNLRLVTPDEFSKNILYEETGQSMLVVGCPDKWEELEE